MIVATLVVFSLPVMAQVETRQADLMGGERDQGKCTIEVEVDGSAEVALSGSTGQLRTVSGEPAHWRRLECTGSLPRNPTEFRFRGIDGRGHVELVRDPRDNRGVAVVRIDDSAGGREGYTFDLEWRGSSGDGGGGNWRSGNSGGGGGNRGRGNRWNSTNLRIISAAYGSGHQFRDVTDSLKRWIRQDRLDIRVDNETLGTDPAPNRRKELRITYEYAGESKTINVREGDRCNIP